jgi:PAS domain S-box-containing protein
MNGYRVMNSTASPALAPGKLLASFPALRRKSLWTSYGVAILSFLGSLAFGWVFGAVLKSAIVTPFFAGVMVSAWYGGFGPGLLTTVLSAFSIDMLFITPGHLAHGLGEFIRLATFLIVSVLTSSLNATRKNAETALRRTSESLEVHVKERTYELIQLNEQLRESEERFRELFEDAPVPYHEIDREGIIRRVNRAECALLGYSPSEMLGHHVWDFVIEEAQATSREQVLRKLSGAKELMPFIREFLRSDGTRLIFEIHEKAIRDSSGAVAGLRSALLDVTEKIQAEEAIRNLNVELERRVMERTSELQRSNDDLQQFAYVASHDLQEPLRMVSSYSSLLAQRYKDTLDEDAREYVHYLVDGANRMSALIRDLLAFSRAGAPEVSGFRPVKMSEVLEWSMLNVQLAIEESGARVTSDPLPSVSGDSIRLVQLMQNLIANAIKYRSEKTPEIHISCEGGETESTFCVSDNGIGFDVSHAERIFGVFKRLHGRKYPGTGIGLAICRRIVDGHGGRIWAASEDGKGARFYFTLPLVQVPESSSLDLAGQMHDK